MGALSKRNAIVGWAAWRIGKRILKRRANDAVPTVEHGRPNKPALVAAGLAAVGGAVFFWRRRAARHAE